MTGPAPVASLPLRPAAIGGSLARNGAISFVGAVLAAVFGFALTVTVSRALGAGGAGLFFTVAALFFIVSNAVELGADTALVWALPRLRALGRDGELRSTTRVALVPVWVVSILSALAVFWLAPWLASLLVQPGQQHEATQTIRVVAPFLSVAAPLAVALAGTRGLGSVVPFTLVGNIGVPFARPVLVLAAVATGATGAVVLLAWASPLVVAAAVAFAVLARQLRRADPGLLAVGLPPRPVREQIREFWGYATPRCFSAMLEIALVWTDVLLVAALTTTRQAGIYAAASRFITTGTLAEGALRVAMGPRLSAQLAVQDRRGSERLQETATVAIVAMSWPLYLALATFSPVILQLFGPGFVEGSVALSVLALSMALSMVAGLAQTVLLMSGHSGWQLTNKVAALTLNVVLNLVLVPRFGIEGAAVAWAVSILADAVAVMIQVRFVVGLHLAARRIALVAAVSVVVYGAGGLLVRWLIGADLASFVGYLLVASGVYAAVLWRLRDQLDLDTVLASVTRRAARPATS